MPIGPLKRGSTFLYSVCFGSFLTSDDIQSQQPWLWPSDRQTNSSLDWKDPLVIEIDDDMFQILL